MKPIKKKYPVEAQIGVQITLEELLQQVVEITLDCYDYDFRVDNVAAKIGGEAVNTSDIKMEIIVAQDSLYDVILDSVKDLDLTDKTKPTKGKK